MCGHDHMHDIHSKYDPATGVLRFVQSCVMCLWSRVVHEEEYRPEPDFDGSVLYMDNPALISHVYAQRRRLYVLNTPRHRGLKALVQEQAVRRAA